MVGGASAGIVFLVLWLDLLSPLLLRSAAVCLFFSDVRTHEFAYLWAHKL